MAFCLGTLVELLDQMLHPDQYHQNWVLDNQKTPQIQSLFEKTFFLRDFLANSTPAIQARTKALEDIIRDAAENAEDILESFLKAHIMSNSVDHMHQLQSLFDKVCSLKKSVAESAPIRANFGMLEDAIRGVAENVEDILGSDTEAQDTDHEKIPQIQALSGKSSFLNDFLANSAPAIRTTLETLEYQIRDAAENAQDLLSYDLYTNSGGQRLMISPPDLSEVIQVFDSTVAEMIKITDVGGQSGNTTPSVHSRSDPNPHHMVVGVDKCLKELNDRLISRSPGLEIIPIVGMGGIGKTTLARKIYNNHSSSKHFDICSWATISQDYDQRQVLLSLLGSTSDKNINELKVDLHKMLWSRRYLIVLDDVWSSKVWDDIRTCAPDNNNRSRIILTTRGKDVSDYVNSNWRHEMQLLDKEDSWVLFEEIVHGGEKCPNELEEIAHEIVKRCRGLPLALQVIGGFMSRAERKKYFWEKVADDISSFIANEDNQFTGIFSWSYANLPHYLKPCLLYIGAFPEDHAIKTSRLIKLWVAEGFLHPIKGKSPEEVGEIYLNALIDRNLIFVREKTFSGRVKSCAIHDLLRDLCLKKAEEKKFIFAKKLGDCEDALCLRRVCVTSSAHVGDFSGSMEVMTRARSFQIINKVDERMFPNNRLELSLMRVLDLLAIEFSRFPKEIFKLINLKYLAISCERAPISPLSILVLKNLETIIFRFYGGSEINFPVGIFHLPQLRHVKLYCAYWAPLSIIPRSFGLGETLRSLYYVPVAMLTQLLGKLPNLKSLGIEDFDEETHTNLDLTSFPVLETIKVWPGRYFNPIFPQSLKKLTIWHAMELSCTLMSRIGALPNLQLLRLTECEFETPTWKLSEGEFCNLQYLRLYETNLEDWIAEETYFPELKHLVIDRCRHLKEIPLEFGGIETLEIIELDYCKASVFDSAKSILQEQCHMGNGDLQLRLGREQRDDGQWPQWEYVSS